MQLQETDIASLQLLSIILQDTMILDSLACDNDLTEFSNFFLNYVSKLSLEEKTELYIDKHVEGTIEKVEILGLTILAKFLYKKMHAIVETLIF